MRFRLIYRGRLPASGNSSKKPEHVRRIRDYFHPQLEQLWKAHGALKKLRHSARVPDGKFQHLGTYSSPFDPEFDPSTPLPAHFVDLSAPIVINRKAYIPLVRESLHLNCSLNILFLRQEDPSALVLQGGDLDGRIKTLFDALRMPIADVAKEYPQSQDPTYCLLESDTLISTFDVASDRLLVPESDHPHEVLLVIEVGINVLRVGPWNHCLLGN